MTEVTPWGEFTDFAKFTGSAWLSSPKEVAHELQRHGYVLNYFLPGGQMGTQFLKAGANIKSKLTLKEDVAYGGFTPSQLIQFNTSQTGDFLTTHWTTQRGTLAWNEREVLLQSEGAFSQADRAQKFFDVYFEKMENYMIGVSHKVEDEFWAVPTVDMENANGNTPRSLWMMINECETSRLTSATTNAPVADGHWPGISTMAGLRPQDFRVPGVAANSTLYGCQQETYAEVFSDPSTDNFATLQGDSMLLRAKKLMQNLKWKKVPRAEGYSYDNNPYVIFGGQVGCLAITQALASTHNDAWTQVKPNSQNEDTLGGHALVRVEGMETSEVYADYGAANPGDDLLTNGGCTEAGTRGGAAVAGAIVGPRLMFASTKDIQAVWHKDKFFAQTDPYQLMETRPDTFAMFTENYRNVHPKRLRTSGFLSPSTDQAQVAY